MFYLKTATWFLRNLYPQRVWRMPGGEKKIYLTFDDGPHPIITQWVLEELKKWNAKATFFCIGKNVVENPNTYKEILFAGHSVGNHTFSHLNGFKSADVTYLNDIAAAAEYIQTSLFRPPYGRITSFQNRQLSGARFGLKTIMWSVLSADFDENLTGETCVNNVIHNANDGAIIVFHDSEKAAPRLMYALPNVLKYLSDKGFSFEKL